MARIVDGPEITGQVVHKQTGQAYGPVTVTVTPKVYTDREMTASVTSLTTDGQGVFSCYAPPGVYTFTTTAADSGPLEPVEVLGKEGGTGGATGGNAASGAVTLTTVATAGASQTVTFPSAGAAAYDMTASAATCTLTLTGGTAAQECSVILYLRQDGTGSRKWVFPTTVQWPSRVAPTFSVQPNALDIVQLTTVDAGATYTASVAAQNVLASTAPDQVTGLAFTPSSTQIVLTWYAPNANGSPITGYKVYRSTSTGTETLLTTLGNVTTYTDTGLTNGTTYFYKVAAVNAVGTGTQSAEGSSTPTTAPTVSDSFTRGDSVSSLGTATTGQAWSALIGTWGIASNKGYFPYVAGTLARAVVDSTLADATVACDITWSSVRAAAGLSLRTQDANNAMYLIMTNSGSQQSVTLFKRVAGTQTSLATSASNFPTLNTTDTISVVLAGTAVTVKKNGTTILSYTLTGGEVGSFLQTATKHGLIEYADASAAGGDDGATRFDNFTVT